MLEEAPAEHQYYDQPKGVGNKSYMSRIHKEHRTLLTSLACELLRALR